MLEHALSALKDGRLADALVSAECVCRAHPQNKIPAILRAHILHALRPEMTADAWQFAWRRAPEDPVLQDQLLQAWLNAGQAGKVAELGPAFLPGRCRNGQHANLLAQLRQANTGWLGACWKAGEQIELMLFAPPGGPAQATLLLANETQQWQYQVPANGSRCRLPCPAPHGVWSLALVAADGAAPQLLSGSPLAFYPAPQPGPATAKPAYKGPHPVSIVIPVYRDMALVQRCLNSVLDSLPRNRTPAKIVVVDDASPEPALSAWLHSLAQQGRITLLRNRFNLGFIETVNRGMRAQPASDVMLLNADTCVHGDWIDRLTAALYQAPDLASVTPWTNNGEMSSFPKMAKAAPAPDDAQLAQLDQAAATLRASGATQDVELPSCCGFTMLLRRSVLDRIGMLDGSALERGYGEETDWCLRARAAGYRHLHATGVYVAHSGTVSFKLEKYLRVGQNNKVVHERYPRFRQEYARFLLSDPLLAARNALLAALPPDCPPPATSDHAPQALAVPPASTTHRVLVWQHRHSAHGSAALLNLARRITTDALPIRLLVIGDVSEALWHTGVVDGMTPGLDSDHLLLDDYKLATMSDCCAILADNPEGAPAGLPLHLLNEHFDVAAWLAGITQQKN